MHFKQQHTHTLPGTQHVVGFRFPYKGINITILDSPGFNDTYRSDTDVLSDISLYLSNTYSQGFRLSGIIYLHPISHARMEGSSLLSLRMFRKLVGDDALSNVLLATTHWSHVSKQEGERRESDLKDTFWKDLINHGATLTRFDGDQSSGFALLDKLINKNRVVLEIQREIVDEGQDLIDTAAGHAVNEELIKMQKKYEEDLKKVKEEMDEAVRDQDKRAQKEIAEVREVLESKVASMKLEQGKLKEQGRLAARDQQQAQSQLQLIHMNFQKQQLQNKELQKELEKRSTEWDEKEACLRDRIENQSSSSKFEDALPYVNSIANTAANAFIMWLNTR